MTCGGCPGERLEAVPVEIKKYVADAILLASCYFAGYPLCPYIEDHKTFIENYVGLPVIIGTHPYHRTTSIPTLRLATGRVARSTSRRSQTIP